MMNRHRVLIASDQMLMGARLKALLRVASDLEIVGEAADAQEAVHVAGTVKPDLVLMDFSMRHTDGTKAIGDMKRRHREVQVIVLVARKSQEYIQAAQDAGADGFVLKYDNAGELLTAIRLAACMAVVDQRRRQARGSPRCGVSDKAGVSPNRDDGGWGTRCAS